MGASRQPRAIVYMVDSAGPPNGWSERAARELQGVAAECRRVEDPRAWARECEPNRPACVVLRFADDPMAGLRLLNDHGRRGLRLPTVVFGSQIDVIMAVAIMKAGAADLLADPWQPDRLRKAVQNALQVARKRWEHRRQAADGAARLANLTRREREVLALVAEGLTNFQVGQELGISERTVEVHRKNIMRKTRAESTVRLVRLQWLAQRARQDGDASNFRSFPPRES